MSADLDTKATNDAALLRELLDTLPIYAARIGIRTTSTAEETEFMHFLFGIHQNWLDWKAQQAEVAS